MHATLCHLITDLTRNSIEADATDINLTVKEAASQLRIVIRDNGRGMNAETLEKAKDPFWTDGRKHPHRKVGLGLPFLIQTADATGGTAAIESGEGTGTMVDVKLDATHVDLPAFGRFSTAAVTLMTCEFDGNLMIERTVNGNSYTVSRRELVDALGDLNEAGSLMLLKQFIEENEKDISAL